MNIYTIIILATLITGFLLNLVSDFLNLKNLSSNIPEEFADSIDTDTYAKSQEYLRTRTHYGFITSTFDLALLLAFWFAGGFNYLDLFVRQYFATEITRGLAYIGILALANAIINLPFSIYSTFVIEEKFGFNRTTVKTYISDLIKSTILSALIGLPVIALIIYIIQSAGSQAFLFAWLAVIAISLIITYIAPTLIMPLFNKFKPLEDGELKKAILDFADKVKFPLSNVFVMDGSKRSSKSNAFFTGFGKHKRIALYDTLIENHDTNELLAVLAHEIGHYKKKHVLQGTIIQFIHLGILFFLMSLFIKDRALFDAFYMENMSIYSGLIFFAMLYTPIDMIISMFINILSRRNEYQADKFAADNLGTGDFLIKALKKLSKDNLSNLTPHPFYVFLNYSHPPLSERIEAIRNGSKAN